MRIWYFSACTASLRNTSISALLNFLLEFPSLLKALVRNTIAKAVLICDVPAAAGHPLCWQQGNGHITIKQFCGSKTES